MRESLTSDAKDRSLQPSSVGRRVALWIVSGFVFLVGCGDSTMPVYPVSGKITFANGKPVVGVGLRVESLDTKGKAKRITSHGMTDAEGRYTLTTFKLDDGAVAGRHEVALDNPVDFVKSNKAKRDPDDLDTIPKPRFVIADRYAEFTMSGLNLEVAPNKDGNTGKDFVVDPYRR